MYSEAKRKKNIGFNSEIKNKIKNFMLCNFLTKICAVKVYKNVFHTLYKFKICYMYQLIVKFAKSYVKHQNNNLLRN